MSSENTFFSILKEHRETKGIQIDEISEYTKINPIYIEAIEEGNFTILPNVYMRLFLRSYAIYLEADSTKVLEDYELHTTGKIKTKSDIDALDEKLTTQPSFKPKSDIKDIEISPKKIITIATVFVSIFLIFQLISTISEQQQDKSDIIEEGTIEDNSLIPNNPSKLDSTYDNNSNVDKFSPLPNLALLNNSDFTLVKKKVTQ